jgi:photosystem II stability/assembly factor-like uncharacterized protein
MQRLIRAVAALAVLTAGCSPSSVLDGAGPARPVLRPMLLASVDMVTPRAGWALEVDSLRRVTGVVRTVDGGRRWERVTPPVTSAAEGTSLSATSTVRAAVAVLRPRRGVTVWRTVDGGRTWTHGATVRSRFGGTVQFAGPRHGWLSLSGGVAAGSSGLRIFVTADGGTTWQPLMVTSPTPGASTPGALPFGCDKGTPAFATRALGYIGGVCAGGAPFFYATADGGRTWRRQTLPGMPRDCQCWVDTPRFFSPAGGALTATVDYHERRLYVTRDAGRAWSALPVRGSAVPFDAAGATVDFVSPTVGFAVPDRPTDRIWATRDGGRHWHLGHAMRAAAGA